MRYKTIDDLPVHCQLNLPRPALDVYKDAWNQAWEKSRDFRQARSRAWEEVRRAFERDSMTGRWVKRELVEEIERRTQNAE